MIDPYVPPDPSAEQHTGPADFASLMAAPRPEASSLPDLRKNAPTDFASLKASLAPARKQELPNTLADYVIDFLTPLLIFFMVNAVMMYILNVRYVYTAVHDVNLRFFTLCFVMGIVALNRLIARDGGTESAAYAAVLLMVVILYTVTTSEMYGVGSVARNFLNDSTLLALVANMSVVIFIWWFVNRLTHECCVDENRVAGDIGIFTATAEQWRQALQRAAVPADVIRERQLRTDLRPAEVHEGWQPIGVVDPTEARTVLAPHQKVSIGGDFAKQLPTRHPGMALFYFSIPIIAAFTIGLRVIQHLGPPAVRMGAFYMMVYTFCVLVLLTLTCLRQLRAYFRLRYVVMPPALPLFWLAASVPMIFLIMWGAASLPMPALPAAVYVDSHQQDVWNPTAARVELLEITPPALDEMESLGVWNRLDQAARAIIALMLLYAALKLTQKAVELALAKRHSLPPWLNWLISAIAWLLFRMWPALFRWTFATRRMRIQRSVALSSRYDNPFRRRDGPTMPIRTHVMYAYEALRALAADLGAPPMASQTPYEFLESYPEALANMRAEAEDLVRLYVIAAYSDMEMDTLIEDRLRKFWIAYMIMRNYYVR